MKKAEIVKKIVKDRYKEIATTNSGCGCGCKSSENIAREIGYSDKDIKTGNEANLGLGCGNPVAISKIKEGDVVLDLGCGAGFDCFLALEKVGKKGRVIGVDMTEEMIKKAKENAKNRRIKNIKFILAEIENIPLPDKSIDIIITNCVINLTPDKAKAFSEAYRVLRPGGKIYLSDIVLLEELSGEQKNDEELITGCVAGALLKEDYLNKIKKTGFKVTILHENEEISKKQYGGIPLESLTIELEK